MKPYFRHLAFAFALGFAAVPAAWAMGTDSDSTKSEAKADPDYAAAEKMVKAGNYADALVSLNKVVQKDPENADAWNYIGYSNRKLGKFPESLKAYEKALSIKPDHRGAIEYLGELYLQTGHPDKAKEQLAKLDKLCTFGCEEYTELKKAINSGKTSAAW